MEIDSMSNIHNNSVLQSSSTNRGVRPNEAQNESNGGGAAGYFAVQGYEEEQEEQYIDRSDYLTAALAGLATINSSRLSVKKNIMKKLAASAVIQNVKKIA